MIFGHIIRAGQRTILAAKTLIIQMPDDSRDRIFFVSIDRAGLHAPRVEAVMTGSGDVLINRVLVGSPREQPDIAPGFIVIQTIQRVTGRHTGFTARTAIQVHAERILLTRLGSC